MAFDSFRDFVNALDKAGELKRISQPVATELEITEIADREMKSPGGGKALLFEKPTVNGVVSPFPVAINTLGSHKRMAMSMGAESVDEVANELGALMKAKPPTSFKEAIKLLSLALDLRHAKPKTVKSGSCKDVIHKNEAPASRKEPWPGAPDITGERGVSPAVSGVLAGNTSSDKQVVGATPITTRETRVLPTLLNLPILKCWPLTADVSSRCRASSRATRTRANAISACIASRFTTTKPPACTGSCRKSPRAMAVVITKRASGCPSAIFIGGDPMFPFAATAPLPDGLDEFLLAGYLRKKSVELVKCETNDLEVPANADFVIEGYIDPTEPLREEGPFGDHTGYYTLPEPYPVFHVTAITHRKDAVYPATIVGIPPMEDFYIGGASVKLFLPIFKMNFPEIVDIALPAEGVFHNLVFVSIKKTYPMQAYKIMHGLWGMGQMMFTKYIVVVDAGVNVHNTSEVLFHLTANTDPQRDSIFTKGPSDVLDHATSEIASGSKLGIDATKKIPGEGFKRAWPPLIKMDEAVQKKIDSLFGKGS